ncbi:MFS transporter [Methanogenium organophilum]|uniref:MFS transporter n=1 Tax=Methanogenium organophilum TaxID=2199 RepID=A0A9X9S5W9_METOG|nr:MFS transporter [Methanogenium organophilum]WAI02008.1 MFS transporter [Methanogenium organophilum]
MTNLRPILGLSAAHVVTDIYSPVLSAILPLLILQYGYSYFLAGLIVTVWNLTSSFTQPLFGWLSDRRGFGVPVKYTLVVCAFFISCIGLITNYWLTLLFAVCAALGHALFHPSALSLVSRLASGPKRGRLTSFFVVGGNIGFAIGPLIAGVLVTLWGLPGLVAMIIPGVCMALILHVIIPRDSYKTEAVPAPASSPSSGAPVRSGFRQYRGITLLITGSAFRAWGIFGSVAFLPAYLSMVRGFDLALANIIVSGVLMAGVIGQVVIGTLSDTHGRKELVLLFTLLAIPFFIAALMLSGTLSLVCLILFGFCLWSTFSTTVAMSHEMMPGSPGFISGLMLGLAVGAGGLGVAVSGYIADMAGLPLAMLLISVPVAVSLVFFALVPYPWKNARRNGQIV